MSSQEPLYGGEAAKIDGSKPIRLGRFTFHAVWRVAGELAGVTLHVFGPRNGVEEEVLRFDCFDAPPHFHLGWSYLDRPYIPIEADDPLSWSLDKLITDMDALLGESEANLLDAHERQGLRGAIQSLGDNARKLPVGSD